MTEIQKFISNYDDTSELINAFKNNLIKIKENNNLILINYQRNISNLSNTFIRQCRGTIIEKDTNKIISCPISGGINFEDFKKKINWNECVIEESIDGTMIVLYYYNDKWNISTKTTIDANCYWNCDKTFKELFNETSNKIGLNLNILNKNFCYTFVLCHPECRNITKYKSEDLYHISSRNMDTLVELDEEIGIKKPLLLKLDKYNKLNINSYAELIKSLDKLNYNIEGYMLYSKDRNYRVKLKGKKHNYVHQLKGNYPNIIQKLLEINDTDDMNDKNEFLKYFPEYIEKFNNIDDNIDTLSKKIYLLYSDVKKNKLENIVIPKIYSKIIVLLHIEYHKLMDKYRPEQHSYKPNITLTKIKHFILNSIEKNYLVAMLNTI